MSKKVPPEVKKADKAQGKLTVRCNAIYRGYRDMDCYLRPAEAVEVAQNLLVKAKLAKQGDDLAVVLRAKVRSAYRHPDEEERLLEFFIQTAVPTSPGNSN
jgi:TfoX/Sxy family transcriptional regulator of competence genes